MTIPDLDFSVVICTYTLDRWDNLCAAVQSVRHQTMPPLEIIVVTDHNAKLFSRSQERLAGVFVVENKESPGLSGARNTGVMQARGAVIAFLDDDAVADPNWLEQFNTSYSDPNVIGVGGLIEPLWQPGRPRWFPAEFDWVVGCTYQGMPNVKGSIRNLIGASMSLRREVFESIGAFRNGMGRLDKYPAGCEETELCIRVRQHWPKRQIRYEPQARVFHHVPASRVRWRYFISRCYTEGLSKALVTHFVGVSDGLASERTYALKILPAGVLRGLSDACLHGDLAGLARAGAIVAGLTLTTAGYVVGLFTN